MKAFITAVLLCIASSGLHAESYKSKDWEWGNSGTEYLYAATTNSTGSSLGQYCYYESEDCYYLVSLGPNCKKENEYPALIGSDKGAIAVTLICSHKYKGRSVYMISPFEKIDTLVRQASRVGIAIPLESDSFKVVRFSLSGSTHAISTMRKTTAAVLKKKNTQSQKPAGNKPDEQYL